MTSSPNHSEGCAWLNKSHHGDTQLVLTAEYLVSKNDSAHCSVENILG